MQIFHSNPFRVLGIKANASAPEKQKVKNRIAAYIKVGKTPSLDFDLSPPLDQLKRTQELIDIKSNEILSDEDKVKNALFWFVSGGTIDDIALSNLTESKDFDKALVNFEKGSKGFVINKSTICSIINHSTLEIINYPNHNDKDRLKAAINRKLDIASSDQYLTLLLNFLNPNNLTIRSNSIKPQIVDSLKLLLKELFPNSKSETLYLEFFSTQKEIVENIKEDVNKTKIERIKTFVNNTIEKREDLASNYFQSAMMSTFPKLGNELLDNTQILLDEIKNSYGENHIKTCNIYEEVLTEVNYCALYPFSALMEEFNSLTEAKNYDALRNLILNVGRDPFDQIIKTTSRAARININVPIMDSIESNLNIYQESKPTWHEWYDQSKSGSSSGSSGDGCGSSIENVLGYIFWGIIIIGFIRGCN